ncbi:hypothetical protein L1987_57411 [Smallanthus sonchifolius]|uniref:Uncharacterized protein n=1 Tax=Smallanthus sonchifolius TaxID=185202 RepID=A0ACB9DCR9_9ASTR|nr:hypothetical protein L1987_57411 [Smallanthus sonchifolius]
MFSYLFDMVHHTMCLYIYPPPYLRFDRLKNGFRRIPEIKSSSHHIRWVYNQKLTKIITHRVLERLKKVKRK